MPDSKAPATTAAAPAFPASAGRSGVARAVLLAVAGACLLTISAKVHVPGPVPMTLQTLAVLGLGAALGARLAVASVLLYLVEGAFGLPVFANTPPMAAGLPYLLGPTGGFLAGFLVAAAIVGAAADRGMLKRPALFASALFAGTVAMLLTGWAWLALGASLGGQTGVGFARAFQLGVEPFLLGETIKLALAVVAFPLLHDVIGRFARR